MKYFSFLFFLICTSVLFYFLEFSISGIPPLGKLLSPHQGYLQNAEADRISISGELNLPGLKDEVTVQFDELLIPHIYAKNNFDLYFAQGYVTAYHRLWQMDLQSYKTAGRLSEIFGESFIQMDIRQRRKGLHKAAEASIREAKNYPEVNEILDAYTAGVNAFINDLDPGDYPLEYKLLDYKPEPWTKLKTGLLAKEMADLLASGEADLEYTNALKLWGKDTLDMIYPENFPEIDPVIPYGTPFDFEAIKPEKPQVEFPQEFTSPQLEKADPRNGSNNFAVNKALTGTESVYFSNEMDLPLNLPSTWYYVHLNDPSTNVMGVSLPGAPFVIVGFNDSIAWGITNAKRDVVDWYYIEFKDENRQEYRYDKNWMKTQKVIEEYYVKNGEVVYDTVIYTHYGPVTYDRNLAVNRDSPSLNLAMKWTAHQASQEYNTFYKLNKASNVSEIIDAFESFTTPASNVAFATTSGDIGIQVSGKFPLKWEEQGKFLMDGRDSRQEWAGMIPYDHYYRSINPERNYVSSANQHPGDSTYPYYDFDYHWEYYRNRRINDRLRSIPTIDEKDMMAIQNDNYSFIAYENLEFMLDSLDSLSFNDDELEFYTMLKDWDYFNEPDLEEPGMFKIWRDIFYELTWDEIIESEVSLTYPSTFNTLRLMRNIPEFSFFDKTNTSGVETAYDLLRESFTMAVDSVQSWKKMNNVEKMEWATLKNTTINHLLRIQEFSVDNIPIGGSGSSVNAASKYHGPSVRLVVELNPNEVNAWSVYPGGQSGNPGNPNYSEMIEKWAGKEYFKLKFSNTPMSANDVLSSTQMKPGK